MGARNIYGHSNIYTYAPSTDYNTHKKKKEKQLKRKDWALSLARPADRTDRARDGAEYLLFRLWHLSFSCSNRRRSQVTVTAVSVWTVNASACFTWARPVITRITWYCRCAFGKLFETNHACGARRALEGINKCLFAFLRSSCTGFVLDVFVHGFWHGRKS